MTSPSSPPSQYVTTPVRAYGDLAFLSGQLPPRRERRTRSRPTTLHAYAAAQGNTVAHPWIADEGDFRIDLPPISLVDIRMVPPKRGKWPHCLPRDTACRHPAQ